jgi:hypothetical protein
VLSYDPLTGIRERFIWNEDGSFQIVTDQFAQPILESNKQEMNQTDERARWKEGQMVASLPLVIYQKLMDEGIIDRADTRQIKLRKWLDDPANRFFRTRPGKLSK